MSDVIESPFGGIGHRVMSLGTDEVCRMYHKKCGADVSGAFDGLADIHLYECGITGYRFWRPTSIAADNELYRQFSAGWPPYYRVDRWEYGFAQRHIRPGDRVLEVGCGQGHFLARVRALCSDVVGLEPNADAVACDGAAGLVRCARLEDLPVKYDGYFEHIVSFQVLEHVIDPVAFLRACMDRLRKGGLLFVSTPNHDYPTYREQRDAFDLPPHHMGHFTPEVFRAVEAVIGARLVEVRAQVGPSGSSAPGPNLFAVFARPDGVPVGEQGALSRGICAQAVERQHGGGMELQAKGFEPAVIRADRELVIWGCGVTGTGTAALLEKCGLQVTAYLDSSPKCVGTHVGALPVWN
ncbi:MAG: class I SAM-dependent methyltransferase, partial [Sedimenticolaceae bacterium]